MFDGLCPALLPSGNAEIRLGAGHWVLGRPALSDRQIPLKNSARQCSSYFQIACAKNTCETALLEIGKVRVAAEACAEKKKAMPVWQSASVDPFIGGKPPSPSLIKREREIPADVQGCCCGSTRVPDDDPFPGPVPLP